ncbi:DUF6265 family protein [Mangrovimonas aestuarii]|uniref:DUF6265 family protein n=1 Tax=Mangrovimonas aestuarii TaxID=3018443 RepID=UPI002377E305|nr:DUF6265 family protein [Mangrovimonas aestuarii]
MKTLLLGFLLTLSQKATLPQQQNINLDWLIGNWVRENNPNGTITYEQWTKSKNGDYTGLGFTQKANDTVFKEHLKIYTLENNLVYEVTGVNDSPIIFKFTEQSTKSFSCYNPDNDFPKTIHYELKYNKMVAIISDDDNQIEFIFTKTHD